MTADVIREAKKSPFIPFDLVLVDGTTYTITHPDYIWVAPFPRAREVVVSAADDDGAGRLSDPNHQSRPGHGSSRSQRQRRGSQ